MNILFKQPRYVLLFSCCAILFIIFVIALAAPILINTVKSDPKITTQFNFPRYLSETELATPPEIQKPVRYTFVASSAQKRGKDINWTRILEKGPYDVVVIGDSFLGQPVGKDLCRKISADNNVSVLHIFTNNIEIGRNNPSQMLVYLINNGFLKKTGARVVILEVAERGIPANILHIDNITGPVPVPALVVTKNETTPTKSRDIRPQNSSVPKTTSTVSPQKSSNLIKPISPVLVSVNESVEKIDIYFFNTSRDLIILKTWVKDYLFSRFGSKANHDTINFMSINESRFTNPVYASRLICTQNDINAFHKTNAVYPDDYIRMNNNLNAIADKLGDDNMTLIFLPGISAYSTYYPYILDPPTVRNPLYEILRELDRSYILVDTKSIADDLQQKGEKDLSGIEDPAHWTWRMTEAVRTRIDLNATPPALPNTADRNTEEEYDRAVQAFRAVMYERGEPDDPWAYKIDGAIYERADDSYNATRCYLRSLQLDPRQPDLRARMQKLDEKNLVSER